MTNVPLPVSATLHPGYSLPAATERLRAGEQLLETLAVKAKAA